MSDQSIALELRRRGLSLLAGSVLLLLTAGPSLARAQEPESNDLEGVDLEGIDLEGIEPELAGLSEGPRFEGYPEERQVGGPTDVDTDLATSFPKTGSLFPQRPWDSSFDRYFELKEGLYAATHLRMAISYQTLYQQATRTLSGSDSAWGGWLLLEGKWDAVNTGEDFQGGLTFDVDWRHSIGSHGPPAFFGTAEVGSLWPTDVAYSDWDPTVALLYWDQWLKQDSFNFRIGKQLAANTYDLFRFKDGRTSFTATPFTAHTSIPMPAFGQAVSFKWWPSTDSSLYVHGTLNDMNGDPRRFGVDTFVEERQYFYGLEVGYFWKRSETDFDHVHLDMFYADEKATQPAPFPSEAGGGFKALGSKQLGQWVGFGSYTYNTALGGGLGATFARDTVTAGIVRQSLLGYRGELGLGAAWMDPIESSLSEQLGGELYWKILVTPDVWVTPGVQYIVDPALSPQNDSVTIAQLKLRLFL